MTRRKHPDATGFEQDLYRVDGASDAVAQVVESKFMRRMDSDAREPLRRLVSGDVTPWTADLKSAWTRFVLSLYFRTPETVAILKKQMSDLWQAALDDLRLNYDKRRLASSPPTYEEYIAQAPPELPSVTALHMMIDMIDHKRFGPTIFEMGWTRVSVAGSSLSLLTSDRPLDWPFGLGSPESYIALPVSPQVLWVAGNEHLRRRIDTANPLAIVKNVNQATVQQARRYVWGVDDRQLRFVENRIGKSPDRPVLSEEQRQSVIRSALEQSALLADGYEENQESNG